VSRNIHQNAARAIFLVIINTVFILNCFFVALLYSTGFEFGPTVFLHIDATAIKVAAGQFFYVLLLLSAIMLPVSYVFYRLVHKQDKEKLSLGVASLCMLALSANAVALNIKDYEISATVPTVSLLEAWLQFNKTDYDDKKKFYNSIRYSEQENKALQQLGIRKKFTPSKIVKKENNYNLIVVYLESLQSNFTKRGGWPEKKSLMPVLDSLRDNYSVFDNMYNSVTPTINAVVSSQCGIDLEIGGDVNMSNAILGGYDKKMRALYQQKLFCLSDYLHQAGYTQIFMKGAPMKFSGKGQFLESHSYDEAIGLEELNLFGKYTERANRWGVPDPILFREAAKELEQLRNQEKPFSINILTINSHTPGFEDEECPTYREGNALLNGIHCTDYSLGWFLDYLEKNNYFKDTVLVLMGDHVMFKSQVNDELLDMLPALSWYGKTYFSIRDPEKRSPRYVDTIGYTADLAPTVTDLLGFGELRFADGRSLLGSRKKYQRLIAKRFEVLNGEQTPRIINYLGDKCSLEELNQATIELSNQPLTDCQREKVYYAKHLFLYN
jgi:phosphoglycerol transferase MdoB-like AlkP superfamily enzyme